MSKIQMLMGGDFLGVKVGRHLPANAGDTGPFLGLEGSYMLQNN